MTECNYICRTLSRIIIFRCPINNVLYGRIYTMAINVTQIFYIQAVIKKYIIIIILHYKLNYSQVDVQINKHMHGKESL